MCSFFHGGVPQSEATTFGAKEEGSQLELNYGSRAMELKGCPFNREDLGEPRDSLIHLGPMPVIKLSSSAYATDIPCLCLARFIWHLTTV